MYHQVQETVANTYPKYNLIGFQQSNNIILL